MTFCFQPIEGMEEFLDEQQLAELRREAEGKPEWFDSTEGLETIEALIPEVKKSKSATEKELLIWELERIAEVLRLAVKRGIRFRFWVDF